LRQGSLHPKELLLTAPEELLLTAPGHEQLVTGFEGAEKAADALAEQLRLRATARLRALHCAGVGVLLIPTRAKHPRCRVVALRDSEAKNSRPASTTTPYRR